MRRSQSRVALVTGGGRRLGKQICLALAREGFDVGVNYHESAAGARSVVETIKSYGRHSAPFKADVSKSSQVDRMIQGVLDAFGRIDVLVNNAAVFIYSPARQTTETNWDTTISINLKGVFLCSKGVIPQMLKQKRGRIINIASLGGKQSWTEHMPYSVAKSGVIMLTQIMAKALAPNVMVNAIAPGTILIPGEESRSIKHISPKNIPMKKYGAPSDITDMVVYLATRASYITGQTFSIDGGRSIP